MARSKEAKEVIKSAAEWYAKSILPRLAVSAIPYIGTYLDLLFSGEGAELRLRRLEHFLAELHQKLEQVESVPPVDKEALHDLCLKAMEKAILTRLAEKRALYANVVARHVIQGCQIDESEMALQMIADLDIVHLEILREAFEAPVLSGAYSGLKIVILEGQLPGEKKEQGERPLVLRERLPNHPLPILRYAVSQLVAKGLLMDEGVGRWSSKPMTIFALTDTAYWLHEWLLDASNLNPKKGS